METFNSNLSEQQCLLLEEYGLKFDWCNLSGAAYSNLYDKVGHLLIKKGINEEGSGETELGEQFHDILDTLYDAYPDEWLN